MLELRRGFRVKFSPGLAFRVRVVVRLSIGVFPSSFNINRKFISKAEEAGTIKNPN